MTLFVTYALRTFPVSHNISGSRLRFCWRTPSGYELFQFCPINSASLKQRLRNRKNTVILRGQLEKAAFSLFHTWFEQSRILASDSLFRISNPFFCLHFSEASSFAYNLGQILEYCAIFLELPRFRLSRFRLATGTFLFIKTTKQNQTTSAFYIVWVFTRCNLPYVAFCHHFGNIA